MVLATILLHYEILRIISGMLPILPWPPRSRILAVVAGVFVAHFLAISLYAVAYYILHTHFELGAIAGNFDGTALDFFYFSITSYTTLGVGDLYPQGPLRLLAGIEALNGFVLVGWSASFTYLAMEKLWEEHPAGRKPRRR